MSSFDDARYCALACVECGERYGATEAARMPASLSCGHTLCAECADAILLCVPPTCTVCKAAVAAEATPNPALAALADCQYQPDCAAAPVCGAHASAPAEAYCRIHGSLLCSACASEHKRCHGAIDASCLGAKAASFTTAAAAAEEAACLHEASKAALRDSADAAVAAVQGAIELLRLQLEGLCARVTDIRKLCAGELKRLDVRHDELVVRASQLRAAAALCACSPGAAALRTLASLAPFDALLRKPVHVPRPRIAVTVTQPIKPCTASLAVVSHRTVPKLERSFATRHGQNNSGLAVSPDGMLFAVSNSGMHVVDVYAAADGAHVRTIGGKGSAPGQFLYPCKLAFHPDIGSILVADMHNKRVQEVLPTGEAVRVIGAGVIDAGIMSVACSGSLVAVGKYDWSTNKRVMLFDYGSGALVRSFGDWGVGVGQLGNCTGLRFTPDGRHVVVANGIVIDSHRLTQFSVDGAFVNEVGQTALRNVQDVDIAASGDWVACDANTNNVVVFAGEDGDEVLRWTWSGGEHTLRKYMALASSNASSRLWVLDCDRGVVKVLGAM